MLPYREYLNVVGLSSSIIVFTNTAGPIIRSKNSQAPAFSLRIAGGGPAVALLAVRHNWSGSAGEVTADGSGPADVMACSGPSELEGIRSTGPLQSESCGGVRGTISPVRLLAHVC